MAWVCEYCSRGFPTHGEALIHEEDCEAKKAAETKDAEKAPPTVKDMLKESEDVYRSGDEDDPSPSSSRRGRRKKEPKWRTRLREANAIMAERGGGRDDGDVRRI